MACARCTHNALCVSVVRKVRTPQGRMPGNARAPQGDGKCNRKHTAPLWGKGEKAR